MLPRCMQPVPSGQVRGLKGGSGLVRVIRGRLRQRPLESPQDIHRCSARTTAAVPRPGIRLLGACQEFCV
jgi:hypothetical protein